MTFWHVWLINVDGHMRACMITVVRVPDILHYCFYTFIKLMSKKLETI